MIEESVGTDNRLCNPTFILCCLVRFFTHVIYTQRESTVSLMNRGANCQLHLATNHKLRPAAFYGTGYEVVGGCGLANNTGLY